MNKAELKVAPCSTVLCTDVGDIEVFGLNETIEYGNGGPGGFGGPGDHNGLADMLRYHHSGGEAELTFHQLDMAVEDSQLCAKEALKHLHAHALTLAEPLRSELLSYLPVQTEEGRGIGFSCLYQEVVDNHPITVLDKFDGAWDLAFHFNFDNIKQIDWSDDWKEIPKALQDERILCVIQGGVGCFEFDLENLQGWLNLDDGYDEADFNRELRKICFDVVFSTPDELHFGTRDGADVILWQVARCLLNAFFPPQNPTT